MRSGREISNVAESQRKGDCKDDYVGTVWLVNATPILLATRENKV